MAGEAPVYRSSRLHAVNPTAAISEDTSYLYTLVRAALQMYSLVGSPAY